MPMTVLKVQVVYAGGRRKSAGRWKSAGEWAPTRKLSLAQGRFKVRHGSSALFRLRFAAIDGTTRIDDVHVDPRFSR
jgi:hypothetical protein